MDFPYGHCFHKISEKIAVLPKEKLKSWSNRELLIMHWYLTKRLDGYGHLTADQSIKDNCKTFREVLRERGIDGVQNVIDNEKYYNWGYRVWQYKAYWQSPF